MWLVLVAAIMWGTTGTAQALGPADAEPLAVGAARLAVGGGLLAAWAILNPRHRGLVVGVAITSRRGMALATLAGALGIALYQVTFFAVVDTAGVALGTAVTIGSAPVFTGIMEWLFRRVRPAARWWLATALASGGVGVLLGPTNVEPSAVGLGLAAGGSYATFAVSSKSLLDRGMSQRTVMGCIFGVAALMLAPVLIASDLSWLVTSAGMGMVVWLGVVTTVVAYLFFAAGLARIPAATAATVSLAEPLTAAVLGVAVLGERLALVGIFGAGLIISGLLVLLVTDDRRARNRVALGS